MWAWSQGPSLGDPGSPRWGLGPTPSPAMAALDSHNRRKRRLVGISLEGISRRGAAQPATPSHPLWTLGVEGGGREGEGPFRRWSRAGDGVPSSDQRCWGPLSRAGTSRELGAAPVSSGALLSQADPLGLH